MASYPPPTENVPIFDTSLFINPANVSLTPDSGTSYFLKYPVAQGNNILQSVVVSGSLQTDGVATFNDNIILETTGDYIQFPDGTQQTTAAGSTSGLALLAGGTSTTPQKFTGVNNFDSEYGMYLQNGGGNIVQIGASQTSTGAMAIYGSVFVQNKIIMTGTDGIDYIQFPDGTQQTTAASTTGLALLDGGTTTTPQTFTGYNQLNSVSVGNQTNTNTVSIESNSDYNNVLAINGPLAVGNTTNTFKMYLNSDDSDGYNLQITNGGISIGSEDGNAFSGPYCKLACDGSVSNKLTLFGPLNINGSTFSNTSTGLELNKELIVDGLLTASSALTVDGILTLVNDTESVTANASSTVAETLVLNGNLQLSGTDRVLSLPYTGNNNISIYQDTDSNFVVNTSLLLLDVGSGNTALLRSDSTTDNQLDVIGNLYTGGYIQSNSGITSQNSITANTGNITATTGTIGGVNGTISTVQTYGSSYPAQNLASIGYVNGAISSISAPVSVTYTSTNSVTNNWTFSGISTAFANVVSYVAYSDNQAGSYVITSLGTPPITYGTLPLTGTAFVFSGLGIYQPIYGQSSTQVTYCSGSGQNYTIGAGGSGYVLSSINSLGAQSYWTIQSNSVGENTTTCPPTANGTFSFTYTLYNSEPLLSACYCKLILTKIA